ncbi:MAG: gfo/Idh/MocA family oxidoreductase [Salinarimonadaceae bacterium]|nr:MAG: gfo/Idh/MocA family oxidoreductase [Salinarimonadaceae bacterium]
MSDHLTVLIAGAGPMAAAYAAVLRDLHVPFAVLGRGEDSAARFEAEIGAPVLRGGLEGLPADAGRRFRAAIVATDIDQLAPVSAGLARAGIGRLLVEKPAGLDPTQIRATAACLAGLGCEAFVAYNRRFYASVRRARELIAEDGGVTSFHFEFTEIEARILAKPRSAEVLANFTLGNSSHVVDLAFHLGGEPEVSAGATAGGLHWHPSAAVFAGAGRTRAGALFTWRADWSSAGRWSLDVRTPRRRLLLEPLETLAVQEKGSFAVTPAALDDADDRRYKPGLLLQTRAFVSEAPEETALARLSAHCEALDRVFLPVFSPDGFESPV